jgi:hypothetical protein
VTAFQGLEIDPACLHLRDTHIGDAAWGVGARLDDAVENRPTRCSKLVSRCPAPALRQLGLVAVVHGFRLLVLVLPAIVPGLRFHPGQFGLFPATTALLANTIEEHFGRFRVGVPLAPVGSQVSPEGGCEHRLPELVQE